ncbi:MAG: hypothetical protein QM758_13210 [Armatimonas sp.]
MREVLQKSPTKILEAEHRWARAVIMRSIYEIRDAFKLGRGRKREVSTYENAITELRKQKSGFDCSSHVLELDRTIAGWIEGLDGIAPEWALDILEDCFED